MKKNSLYNLLIIIALFAFSACNKDKTQDEIKSNIESGSWKITKFIDSGNDETSYFAGYVFTFDGSGTLTATDGTSTESGSWGINDSNSSDDSQDDLDLVIYFNATNNFEELNDDWDFKSQSGSKIELIDVSGGNGGTDYLTFEKI